MGRYISLLVCLIFVCFQAESVTFTTGFESENASTVQTVNITNNGLTLTLTGGTAFRIGNGSLYHSGLKSWMLDPAGTTARGTSSGMGIITFSEDAQSVDFYIRTSNASSTAQVVIADSTGAILDDQSGIGHSSWTHIQHEVVTGAPLISEITVTALGTDMLAIDTFSFSTEPINDSTDNNTQTPPNDAVVNEDDRGSGGLRWIVVLLLMLTTIRKPAIR